MHTQLCDLLNIQYPIIQGGMAWVSTGELAAAVSEAGGLGIIAAGNAPAEYVQREIDKLKKITDKPYGVNAMLLSPYIDEVMEVILAQKVPVITTGAGNPSKYIPALKENNTKVIPVVASVALAQRLEKAGVDAIIAEGMEGGGHIGEITTMALVPQIVDAVKIPVIAAGGIADARGFIAAMALGAVGVQMGTRFMCAKECIIHENIKQSILKAKDRDTIITGRVTGHPVRILKNKLAKQFEQLERDGSPKEKFEQLGVGKLKAAMVDGDKDYGSIMAGQVAGMIKKEENVAEIINEIITEAQQVIKDISQIGGN